MTNNTEKIKLIFEILKKAGINKYDDLTDKILTKGKLLSAQIYTWIADLVDIIRSFYYYTENHISNIDGQVFLVDEIQVHNHQNILKYSCIFPNRMIISSGEFHYLDKAQCALIDIDFFRKLFWSRELLLDGIVHISPFYLCADFVEGEGDINNAIIENLSLPDKNKKKIAQLDKSGLIGVDHIPFVDKIFVEMPWLSNVSTKDYLDIIKSNETEFLFFNQYLSNLSSATEDTEAFLKKFSQDFGDANINIKIALEKKQAELKSKGIISFLSVCLTVIPLIIPNNSFIDPQTLSAILGGGTIKQLIDGISLVNDKKAIGRDNPFWVLWKWKNS